MRKDEEEVVAEEEMMNIGDDKDGGAEEERWEEAERIGTKNQTREMRKLVDPRLPTVEERREHELTHIPYRNWCPHCIRGRGKDLDHRKGIEEERGLSEYIFDYCFPGDEFGFKLTILVGKERNTGMSMATTVPVKGSSGKFSAQKILEFIEECGDSATDIIVKSDQEPAITILMKDLMEERGDLKGRRTILEEAPVKSKGSNGQVERAVQTIEGHLRTMKSAFEGRINRHVDVERRIVYFMAEYAAYLSNRLEVGKDGKTSYERSKGKKPTVLGIEFGEKLMWLRRTKEKMEKMQRK